MSDYEPMSAPPPERGGPQPRGEPPASIQRAVQLVWAIVALSVLNVVLTFVLMDSLVSAAIDTGAQGLTEAAARTGVVIGGVFGLIFAGLWLLLGFFLRRGSNWARIVLTVLAGIGVLFGLSGLALGGGGQGGLFLLVSIVTLVLEVALLYFLWQRDSTAYLKPRPTR